MIKQIATVGVYVEDQEKSLEFWTGKLGFKVYANKEMGPNARWIEVGPPNAQTRLVIYLKTMKENVGEFKPSIVFECDNIDETYEELKGKGLRFTQDLATMPWGTFAIFEDLDGNEFLLKG